MSGPLSGVLAFVIWGFASSVILRGVPLPGPVASCLGMAIGAISVLIIAIVRGRVRRLVFWGMPVRGLVGLALASSMCSLTYQWSIKTTTVANAVLTHALQPLLTCLVFAPLFLKLRPDRRALISLVLGIAGMMLLLGPELHWDGSWFGITLGIVSAVFFAWFNVLLPKLQEQMDTDVILFWCLSLGTLMVVPFAVAQPMPAHVDAHDWGMAALYGVTNFMLAFQLYWWAAKRMPMTQFSVLAYLEPVVAISAAAIWLGEAITPHAIGGGALILAAGAVVVFGNKNAR